MNGKIMAWLFPALLAVTLFMIGSFSNAVDRLEIKMNKMAVVQSADGAILRLLERKFLK